MYNLKEKLLFLLSWFAFMLIIGFVDKFQMVDYQIYVISLLLTVAFIALPQLAEKSRLTGGLLLVLGYTVLYSISYGLVNYIDYAGLSLNALMLVVYFALMRSSIRSIEKVDTATKDLIFGLADSQTTDSDTGIIQIERELDRARRFNHPVSIVFVDLVKKVEDLSLFVNSSDVQWKLSKKLNQKYYQNTLYLMVKSLTYDSDIVFNHRSGIAVCLPESTVSDADILVDRLCELVQTNLGMQLVAGVAGYPDEALVAGELLRIAVRKATTRHFKRDSGDEKTIAYRTGDLAVNAQRRYEIELETDWITRFSGLSFQQRVLYDTIRRIIEVGVVIVLLPLVLPTMLLIALAIFLDDQDDIFYLQARTGYNGKRFMMYKFRTMKKNVTSVAPKSVTINGITRYYWPEKQDDDDRITRVGRILRKTSLDELPQLLNILKGDMSFVGPRPTSWDLDKYTPQQTTRLRVRPGITGLWQVFDRHSSNFDERIIWDSKYIQKMNPLLDLYLIFMTVMAVFKRRGV